MIRLHKLRYKRGYDLAGFKWFLSISSLLIFQCMISTVILLMTYNYVQNIPTLKIFLISDLIFVVLIIYFSRWINNHLLAERCKIIDFNSERTFEIQEDYFLWEDSTFSGKYSWKYFKAIKQFDKYVILKLKIGSILLPKEAFNSEQEVDDFVNLAHKYKLNACGESDSDIKKKPVSKKSLIFLAICLTIIFLPKLLLDIGSKNDFWSQVFNDGNPQMLYQETTEGFKSRISEEQWDTLVSQWRSKLGPWKKTRIISFVPYDCRKFPDRMTKASEHFNTIQKSKCKVIGSNGVAYITSYRYRADGDLMINGFEIVFEATERQLYLFDKDVKFVEAHEE